MNEYCQKNIRQIRISFFESGSQENRENNSSLGGEINYNKVSAKTERLSHNSKVCGFFIYISKCLVFQNV